MTAHTNKPAGGVVFFVDDDAAVRRVTCTVLERNGYAVLEAGSAEEAVRLLESHPGPINVLLMDINLPDGWGGALAQRLLGQHPEMSVVYTTGFADTDPVLSGALHDAPYVLRKPFSSKELLDVVGRAAARE